MGLDLRGIGYFLTNVLLLNTPIPDAPLEIISNKGENMKRQLSVEAKQRISQAMVQHWANKRRAEREQSKKETSLSAMALSIVTGATAYFKLILSYWLKIKI